MIPLTPGEFAACIIAAMAVSAFITAILVIPCKVGGGSDAHLETGHERDEAIGRLKQEIHDGWWEAGRDE